jgi:Uma2 family endonuclease
VSVAFEQHSGPWTVDDVLALPEDSRTRIELVGGALVMSPSPGVPHQRASRRLAAILEGAADAAGGLEVLEAVNLIVPDGLVIPDIVVADAQAAAEAKLTLDPHDVILVVEIASPSTRVTDTKLKPQLYAAAGIPSYWRVDLEPVPRVTISDLQRGTYLDRPAVLAGSQVVIDGPGRIGFDPSYLVL